MSILDTIREKAKQDVKRIVFPEGTDVRILRAAQICRHENLVEPVVIGASNDIASLASENDVDLSGVEVVDPAADPAFEEYAQVLFEKRKHKGLDLDGARATIKHSLYYGAMMVDSGRVDASVAGAANTTGDVLRAAIQVIGVARGFSVVSSTFLMVLPDGTALTYADCGVVPQPTAEQLAEIAVASAKTHQSLTGEEPLVAMLSFSTKGSAKHPLVDHVVKATEMARKLDPKLKIDGEMQFDAALIESIGQKKAPGSPVAGKANVLIFPDLQAGNIGYKMTERLGKAEAIGPIIQGLVKPANDLSRGCKVDDVVNVACICSLKSKE